MNYLLDSSHLIRLMAQSVLLTPRHRQEPIERCPCARLTQRALRPLCFENALRLAPLIFGPESELALSPMMLAGFERSSTTRLAPAKSAGFTSLARTCALTLLCLSADSIRRLHKANSLRAMASFPISLFNLHRLRASRVSRH